MKTVYFKACNFFALFFEFNYNYKDTRIFTITSCNGENIIDIPYCRIIYTPGRYLKPDMGKGVDEHRNKTFSDPATGIAKN